MDKLEIGYNRDTEASVAGAFLSAVAPDNRISFMGKAPSITGILPPLASATTARPVYGGCFVMSEIWELVIGWEGLYEVSNQGRVRSLDREKITGRKVKGKILCLANIKGYLTATLCKDGRSYPRKVHHLVLEVFVGPCPEGYQCNHKNGIKADNKPENLEWVTPSENVRHSYKYLGKVTNPPYFHGENHPRAKLNWSAVNEIRRLHSAGWSYDRLAEKYRVGKTTIGHLLKGDTWNA